MLTLMTLNRFLLKSKMHLLTLAIQKSLTCQTSWNPSQHSTVQKQQATAKETPTPTPTEKNG